MNRIEAYSRATAEHIDALNAYREARGEWVEAAKALVLRRFNIADALEHLGNDAPQLDAEVDEHGLRLLLDAYPHVWCFCEEVPRD